MNREKVDLFELGWMIHRTAFDKGFWEEKTGEDRVNQVLAKMMLIDSEVSEMMEAYRKSQGSDRIVEEAADIFIRLLDLLQALKDYGITEHDFTEVLLHKVGMNQSRPSLHGNLM